MCIRGYREVSIIKPGILKSSVYLIWIRYTENSTLYPNCRIPYIIPPTHSTSHHPPPYIGPVLEVISPALSHSCWSLSPPSGRLWDCIVSVWDMQGTAGELGAAVMQQADVSALRLLEALVLTLPQTLLQTYILAVTDVELDSPGKTPLYPINYKETNV